MNLTEIPERIAYLVLMYLHGKLTPPQRVQLDQWLAESEEHEKVFDEAVDFFV